MTTAADGNDHAAPPRPAAWGAMAAIAIAALAVSAYLTYASTVGGGPLGCGGGSGCGEVLGSKWSKVAGVPVSGLAVLAYVAVLAALQGVRPGVRPATPAVRRSSWALLVGLASLIAAAALWYTFLQLAVLRAVCPYCMADHALGLVLAILIFASAPRRPVAAIGAGVAAVIALGAVQAAGSEEVVRLDTVVISGEAFVAPQYGDPAAERSVALMFDYACPHCRHAHGVIREHLEAGASPTIRVSALPTPIHRGCNPFALEEMPARFDESCELARIALAVYVADAERFEAFDGWMFEPETPRTAAAAREKAAELVGAAALEAAYADPRVGEMIEQNVAMYGDLGDMRRVPVTIVDGRAPAIGPLEDAAALQELLAEPPAVP